MKNKLPSIIITAACIVCMFLPTRGFTSEFSLLNSLAYPFFHANVFHFIANMVALWMFRPRISTSVVAYISCVVASFIPFTALSVETVGISGFIYAAYARKYVSWKYNVMPIVLSNIIFVFIPVFNWKIHLVSFFISYIYYAIFYRLHRQRTS